MNNVTVMGKFALTEEVMRRDKLLNMTALLYPRDERFRSAAKASAKILFSSIRQGQLPKNVFQHLQNVIMNIDDLVVDWYKYNVKKEYLFPDLSHGGWSDHEGNEQKYTKFEVLSQTEQTPNPDNRVTLSNQLDKLGCPQAKLTNHWSEIDICSVKRSQLVFAEEFASAGLGELQIELDGDRPVASLSTHHNMGTT
ncbi:MAG: GMC family oxidoreductase, partial [Nostoc sp.]